MYLNLSSPARQLGLGLPVALFIIVIMSLIAVAVSRLTDAGGQAFTQNLLSSRAFYAAESGAQLRTKNVLVGPPCVCDANLTYNFVVTGLNSCSAETSCSSLVANGETYCTITSIGRCDNSAAERTVEVRVK
jgi:MSHA biogenesis protein MshP